MSLLLERARESFRFSKGKINAWPNSSYTQMLHNGFLVVIPKRENRFTVEFWESLYESVLHFGIATKKPSTI